LWEDADMPIPTPIVLRTDTERVTCSSCEACCCRLQVLLMPGDDVPARYVDQDHGLDVMERLDDGWCIALDRNSMRCTIYSQRPLVCREYAMGEADCREERAAWQLSCEQHDIEQSTN
jgi:uncharacterized protein